MKERRSIFITGAASGIGRTTTRISSLLFVCLLSSVALANAEDRRFVVDGVGATQLAPEELRTQKSSIRTTFSLAAVIRLTDAWTAELSTMQANPVPTIAVVGDRDPLIVPARNLAGNLANFRRLEVLVGATHGSVMRDSTHAFQFGERIQRYITSVETDAAISSK